MCGVCPNAFLRRALLGWESISNGLRRSRLYIMRRIYHLDRFKTASESTRIWSALSYKALESTVSCHKLADTPG